MQLCILGGMAEEHCLVGRQPDTSSLLALAKVHKGECLSAFCLSGTESCPTTRTRNLLSTYVMVSERDSEWVLIMQEVDADGSKECEIERRSQGSGSVLLWEGEGSREIVGPISKGYDSRGTCQLIWSNTKSEEGNWQLIGDLSSPNCGSMNYM